MPLYLNGQLLKGPPTPIINLDSQLPIKAASVCSMATKTIGPKGLLYVNQREYAVVSPKDPCIEVVGSDECTTCHLLIIRHLDTGVTGFAHCDGCDTEHGIEKMVADVKEESGVKICCPLNVYLVGGFTDKIGYSVKLTIEILRVLGNSKEELHLCLLAVNDANTKVINGVNFPKICGLAVTIAAGQLQPATFPAKGPDIDIRSACHFGGFESLMKVYSSTQGLLKIGPYTWNARSGMEVWLHAPDYLIRQTFSTSPKQESPGFADSVRKALKVLVDYPHAASIFIDEQPRLYSKSLDGSWIKGLGYRV